MICVFVFVNGLLILNECLFEISYIYIYIYFFFFWVYTYALLTPNPDSILTLSHANHQSSALMKYPFKFTPFLYSKELENFLDLVYHLMQCLWE